MWGCRAIGSEIVAPPDLFNTTCCHRRLPTSGTKHIRNDHAKKHQFRFWETQKGFWCRATEVGSWKSNVVISMDGLVLARSTPWWRHQKLSQRRSSWRSGATHAFAFAPIFVAFIFLGEHVMNKAHSHIMKMQKVWYMFFFDLLDSISALQGFGFSMIQPVRRNFCLANQPMSPLTHNWHV